MAKLVEKQAVENQRADAMQQRQIHLFADGSFYRAYEWSAWLCCRYVNKFQTTKRHNKTLDMDLVFVGFPKASLPKFTPENVVPVEVSEGHLVMTLTEIMMPVGEDYNKGFENWKTTIPLVQTQQKPLPTLADRPVSMTGIMKKVMGYNVLEQYMKRTLHCRHYGRYVDDFYVVSTNREWLRSLVKPVRDFLREELHLSLHEGKVVIHPIQYGVPFLGMYIKPWRMTVTRESISRMQEKSDLLFKDFHTNIITFSRLATALASFRGILTHGYNEKEQV